MSPVFPALHPLTINDRGVLNPLLKSYNPQTSELTFVNLYIWREYYQFSWALYEGCLIVMAQRDDVKYALPPIGAIPRASIVKDLLHWMHDDLGISSPYIARADKSLVDELGDEEELVVTPTRDHYDYVYLSEDLGLLAGRRYSKKRNHINQFLRNYEYTYTPISPELVPGCIALAEVWCEQRLCEDDISLSHEFRGIRDALFNFDILQIEGGAIFIDGRIQAFALGEILNSETAVVHIEKANPEYHGIYPMMTREFAANRWMDDVKYINREQDIGEPGLRRAKESYYPDHLVEKYEIRLTEYLELS
jgi:hypothetical protein